MRTPHAPCSDLTISELAELYIAHAQVYYRRRDRSPTGEHLNIQASINLLIKHLGPSASVEHALTKHALRDWLLVLVDRDLTRAYINATLSRVRRMIRWASDLDYVSPNVEAHIRAVRPLPPHRSPARENTPRRDVHHDQVAQILPFLPVVPRRVVQLLSLTGARVGEILALTNADLTTDEDGRCFAIPPHHKTTHHGRSRVIPFNARCMQLLEPHLRPWCPDDFLFPSPKSPNKHYHKATILTAIKRACVKAGTPTWCTHQLRHTAATTVRRARGLEAAQQLLGHSSRATTERYTHTLQDLGPLFAAQEVLQ